MNTVRLQHLISVLIVMLICLTPGVALSAPLASLPDGIVNRVSLAANGTQANAPILAAGGIHVSGNGHYAVFSSLASNLVPGDANGKVDVFVVDRPTNQIVRISMGLSGEEANGDSYSTNISPDGSNIVFYSQATNLVTGDTNGVGDVFIYNQTSHTIVRVSLSTTGEQGDANSAEGHISYDGRHVAFSSLANNFAGESGAFDYDVFVRDRDTDHDGIFDEIESAHTFRITIGAGGAEPDTYNNLRTNISGNGRFVSFNSDSTNLISPPDLDNFSDVFVRDRDADGNGVFDEEGIGATRMIKVSVDPDGNPANAVSYLHESAPMSEDGRYITFPSEASNLVNDDSNQKMDIFVRDIQTEQTALISLAPDGAPAEGKSYEPFISSDGRYFGFQTAAANLVIGDDNNRDDCVIHDRLTGNNILASLAWNGSQANGSSGPCYLSANGLVMAFLSDATNLVPGDTNTYRDAFVFVRLENHTYLPRVIK
jgi:Tol biopolymer transport system component